MLKLWSKEWSKKWWSKENFNAIFKKIQKSLILSEFSL